jgi:CrcB protein
VFAAMSAGGAVGAVARYAASVLWPAPVGAFPWAVFWVNVLGCGLIGVLMVLVSEHGRAAHPLVRPFLGVGVLGGFTTFSTYALDFSELLEREEAETAMVYAAGTVAGAVGAVWTAAVLTRGALARRAARQEACR